MERDITNLFLHESVDHLELLHIFQEHLGGGCLDDEDVFLFPCSKQFALKVTLADQRITKIERGTNFTAKQITELQLRIQLELREDQGIIVGRDILFHSWPVNGAFTSKMRQVQILPAPSTAPRPTVLWADHPFVLEFTFRKSSNPQVTHYRQWELRHLWAWLFNAILRGSVKYIGPRSRRMWAIDHDEMGQQGTETKVRWSQEFYIVPGFQMLQDNFSVFEHARLALIPENEYYSTYYSEEMSLPYTIDEIIGAYVKLSGDKRRRFQRALSLVYNAQFFWEHNISSYYIAFVQAIETLSHSTVRSIPCPTCKRDISPGPTKRFADFVNQYATDLQLTNKQQRWLYDVRSRIVHGAGLFQIDERPWNINFSISYSRTDEAYKLISRLTRSVLINWLKQNTD